MKQLVLIVIFYTGFLSSLKSQNCFPLTSDSAKWSILSCWYNFSPPGMNKHTSIWQFKKDTLMCGKIYSMFNSWEHTFYRSDSERVYIKPTASCGDKEYLLYDFNMNAGDSAWFYCRDCHPFSQLTDTVLLKVITIDTITFSGFARRRLQIKSEDNEYPDSTFWIKGIGSTYHPFYSVACLGDGCEGCGYALLCYDSSQIDLYKDSVWNTCDTSIVGIESNNKSQKSRITISPNPTSGIFRIEQNIALQKQALVDNYLRLEIYTILGEKISSFTRTTFELGEGIRDLTFDISGEPPGIYFMKIYGIDKSYFGKVLKE